VILRREYRRILVVVFLGFIILGVSILTALPSLMMRELTELHVDFDVVYDAEQFGLEATELTLKTADGYSINAFDVRGEAPKAVVVFISGIHNPSVTAFFGHARMFAEHGYASVLYDMRAHGKSEGDLIGLGYLEVSDTQAVVDYVKGKEEYRDLPIIVYGLSMGGAVAINSTGRIPEIDGLVSLSAYSSWEDVFADNMMAMGAPKALAGILKPFMKLYALRKFGRQSWSTVPKKQIARLGQRPALLMHSLNDTQVPHANLKRIVASAPSHVETWERPGDHHLITTDFLSPEHDLEYAEVVLGFLKRHWP
jgi:pimeloyl-ACP methyl ester carboxylesterase